MKPALKYLPLLFTMVPLFVVAQKLPKLQTTSIRAPKNIKIDGKLTEWNNQLQAYNPANRLFYTLANDDVNLYIAVCADETFSIRKLLMGGITTTVTTLTESGAKTRPQRIDAIITYPVINDTKEAEDLSITVSHGYIKSDKVDESKADSVSTVANKQITRLFKLIEVHGIRSITEPTLSIYNARGVEVSARVNTDLKFVYELAIPLKYLNIAPNSATKLKYSIKLNGEPEVASNGIGRVQFSNPASVLPPESMYMQYPTYFSGEYELAK